MSALPQRALIRTQPHRSETALPISRVGIGLTVIGHLETDGELQVYGKVQGSLCADKLVLAPDGEVEGDIVARDALIGGRVNGRVFALNVTVESTADIKGRIFHHTVEVARGARVDARMPWRPLNFFETLEQIPETQP
jgi:cytoskeletal protein CcmA (bactofilin family)